MNKDGAIKIRCPKCGRCIGDTKQNVRVTINCHKCGPQEIAIKITRTSDYLKGAQKDDKSK